MVPPAALCVHLCIGQAYAFSVFNLPMTRLLGITKRTLARYRQKKLVTYYMIDGRTYYKASEVEAFLNQKGKSLPARFRHQPNV